MPNLTSLIASLALLTVLAVHSDAAPPNIVLFISDDHGYLDSTVAGSPDAATPHLARLAADGLTFTNAFVASPACAPSRAALLTGLMPNRNGSMINHQPPRTDVKKLPAYLHELGYEVVAFGKVGHYLQTKDYGFDVARFCDFHDHRGVPAAVKFMQKWKADKQTKPLCILVGTNWPHVPWPEVEGESTDGANLSLPPTHVDTAETRRWRARYMAAVKKFDDDLGVVYDAAYQSLGPNTLFVQFSDHGAQWPFGKWNLYGAGTQVSCFAVWPGVVEPGRTTAAMVSLVDVLPTLIDAAGETPPADLDGKSLVPLLRGKTDQHRDAIFTTHSSDGRMNDYPIRAVRTLHWSYIRNLRPDGEHHTHIDRAAPVDGSSYWKTWVEEAKSNPAARAIVDRYYRRPAEELYDLKNDPHEQRNLAADPKHAATLAEMSKKLDAWMQAQGDEGITTEATVAAEFKEFQSQNQKP